jgi:hypothetical protein
VKSSRNAYRHGLSLPLRLDNATSAKADAIAHALAQDKADGKKLAQPKWRGPSWNSCESAPHGRS